jgi:hypothetical protein
MLGVLYVERAGEARGSGSGEQSKTFPNWRSQVRNAIILN